MSGATPVRSSSRAPAALPFSERRIRLDGWAQIGAANHAHYVRDGLAICRARNDGGVVRLLGTLKGRTCCERCTDRLAAVSS